MQTLYTFRGKVRQGAKRGRNLGFPTANILLHQQIPEGIYASSVKINSTVYPAATFIGSAKTFGEKDYKAEVYILDFDKTIYGTVLLVKLIKKIRENMKFSDKNALIEQMKKDVEQVKEYFRQ